MEKMIYKWYDIEGFLCYGNREQFEEFCRIQREVYEICKPKIEDLGKPIILGSKLECDFKAIWAES